MPKLFALLFLPALCLADPLAVPASSGYYNQAAFTQAVAAFVPGDPALSVDTFSGAHPQSGVSVSSDIIYNGYNQGAGDGHFVPGAYQDATEKYSSTVWTFSQPVYAFGGNWNLPSVNAGLQINADGQIYFMPDGVVAPLSSYGFNAPPAWPSQSWSGFWGFVSTTPISSVSISFGDEGSPGSFGQTYSFSNMETVSATPEPSCLVLIVSGLLITAGLLKRRSRRTQ